MNAREARFILEAYHAHEVDEGDPRFTEALLLMESDPELANWFYASQDFDRAVRAKVQSVPVPEAMLERIRAGQPVLRPQRPTYNRRSWLAMAASLAVFGGVAGLIKFRTKASPLTAFRSEMVAFLETGWDHGFDMADEEFLNVKRWLESQGQVVRVDVPLVLAASRTVGCKTLRWKGQTAALVCFLPSQTETVVHILIVNQRAISDPPGTEPQLLKLPHWNSAAWSTRGNVYLALTTADSEKLAGCL